MAKVQIRTEEINNPAPSDVEIVCIALFSFQVMLFLMLLICNTLLGIFKFPKNLQSYRLAL
jgi:hypothetical protein